MLASLLSVPALATIGGALILGYGAQRKSKKAALVMLAGFAIMVTSVPMHLVSASGFFNGAVSIFLSAGIGMALVGLMAANGGEATKSRRQFMVLAVASVVVAILIRTLGVVLGASDADSTNATSEEATTAVLDQVADQGNDIGDSILVELGPDDTIEEILPLIEEYGGIAERAFPSISLDTNEDLAQVFIVSGIKKDLLLKLIDLLRERISDVDHVEINEPIALDDPAADDAVEIGNEANLTNDPLAEQQWAMQVARIDAAHQILKDIVPERKAVVEQTNSIPIPATSSAQKMHV